MASERVDASSVLEATSLSSSNKAYDLFLVTRPSKPAEEKLQVLQNIIGIPKTMSLAHALIITAKILLSSILIRNETFHRQFLFALLMGSSNLFPDARRFVHETEEFRLSFDPSREDRFFEYRKKPLARRQKP